MSNTPNLYTLRFYAFEQILKHEPSNGWTVDSLFDKLTEIVDSVTEKQIRTILNGLEDAKLLKVEKDGKTKHFYLDRYSNTLPEDDFYGSESEGNNTSDKSYTGLVGIYNAMLTDMNLEDLGPVAQKLKNQLAYVINEPGLRQEVTMLSDQIMINENSVSRLNRRQSELLVELLSQKGQVAEVMLTDSSCVIFYPDFVVIRNTCIICCGIEVNSGAYREILLTDIADIASADDEFKLGDLSPREQARLLAGRITIGEPTGDQPEQIVVRIDLNVLKRLKAKPMPVDFDLDAKNMRLYIEHEPSKEMADWILGLGPGAVVEEPVFFRELVRDRLSVLLKEYD